MYSIIWRIGAKRKRSVQCCCCYCCFFCSAPVLFVFVSHIFLCLGTTILKFRIGIIKYCLSRWRKFQIFVFFKIVFPNHEYETAIYKTKTTTNKQTNERRREKINVTHTDWNLLLLTTTNQQHEHFICAAFNAMRCAWRSLAIRSVCILYLYALIIYLYISIRVKIETPNDRSKFALHISRFLFLCSTQPM